jgi:peptidoglycan/xylan/chitin deacetylase (PgdA/CDA1 family)
VIGALASLLSPAGRRARLQILIFHRVLAQPDPLFPGETDAARFDRICGWVRRWFKVLPLDEAVQMRAEGRLPARALSITFDDGYADNHDVALPILRRHGLTACFFIATGYLGGGRMFNDGVVELVRRSTLPQLPLDGLPLSIPGALPLGDLPARRAAITTLIDALKYRPVAERLEFVRVLQARAGVEALPDDLMMRPDQVVALHGAGMQIGAHTVTHPILARLSAEEARAEIERSKAVLEEMLGRRVGLFAYPNGRPGTDYDADSVRLVRQAGFDAAVSTAWGSNRADTDTFQLARFTPWDRTRARFGARLLVNLRREPALLASE